MGPVGIVPLVEVAFGANIATGLEPRCPKVIAGTLKEHAWKTYSDLSIHAISASAPSFPVLSTSPSPAPTGA